MPSDAALQPEDPDESTPGSFDAFSIGGLDVEFELKTETLGSIDQIGTVLRQALEAAMHVEGLKADAVAAELFVQIVDPADSEALNTEHRGKAKPTNVLSFPGEEPDRVGAALAASGANIGLPVMLGDIVVCGPVIVREAAEQGKAAMDHLQHMIVHGFMHLLGYDHIEDSDAAEMEAKETVILKKLNVSDPYEPMTSHHIDHPEPMNV